VNPFPRIDVRRDRKGEYFDLAIPDGVEMEVIDADAAARHLVLMARMPDGNKARYLAGHDERHWFVAAVPESYPATTVQEAQRALQPDAVKDLTVGLDATKRIARHNAAYRRQGEWYFIPDPDFVLPPNALILRNEPLSRGAGSTAHIASEAYRFGGETRYQAQRASVHAVRDRARAQEIDGAVGGKTLDASAKAAMEKRFPEISWRSVLVNPTTYVRGPIRHPDHSTIDLKGWHRVMLNAENLAKAASHIVFVD